MGGVDKKVKKRVGRPSSDNPKIRVDIRFQTSVIMDIELISEYLGVTPSSFLQTIAECECEKYKKLFKL